VLVWVGEDVRDWPAAAVVGLLLEGIAWRQAARPWPAPARP